MILPKFSWLYTLPFRVISPGLWFVLFWLWHQFCVCLVELQWVLLLIITSNQMRSQQLPVSRNPSKPKVRITGYSKSHDTIILAVKAVKTTEEVEPEEHTPFAIKLTVIMAMTGLLTQFAIHCTYITSNYYSSPSVVLASSRPDGSRNIIDDYRYEKKWPKMSKSSRAYLEKHIIGSEQILMKTQRLWVGGIMVIRLVEWQIGLFSHFITRKSSFWRFYDLYFLKTI